MWQLTRKLERKKVSATKILSDTKRWNTKNIRWKTLTSLIDTYTRLFLISSSSRYFSLEVFLSLSLSLSLTLSPLFRVNICFFSCVKALNFLIGNNLTNPLIFKVKFTKRIIFVPYKVKESQNIIHSDYLVRKFYYAILISTYLSIKLSTFTTNHWNK